MENALLVGLSRQNALQRELDVVANNIANMNTTGYKADGAVFAEYLNTRARGDQFATSDKRVSFVQDRMTWHDMTPGAIQQTGNPLDVAIDGDAFIAVQTPRGERYTRNGSLQVNAAGELVTSAGDKVLGDAGPIVMQNTDRGLVINPDGSVRVQASQLPTSDQGRGKIRLVSFANAQQLRKDGNSTFLAPDGVTPQPATNARLVQGAVERSNVRSVVEMTRMIELTRAYSDVAGIIQQQADLRRTSIERLADVPA